jgi:hypothetical protein
MIGRQLNDDDERRGQYQISGISTEMVPGLILRSVTKSVVFYSASSSDNVASNLKMIKNNIYQRIWKTAAMADFKAKSLQLSGRDARNHENLSR